MENNQQYALVSTKMPISSRFSVAPMLNWTDRHCRFFLRQFSRHTLLYTEMITTEAVLFSKVDYLNYNNTEHPLALQLCGNEPHLLARCAKMAEARNYDEINLNVGCPSNRLQNKQFGAYMMAKKNLVAACIASMREVVTIPVTVKTRLGIDMQDNYAFLCEFINTVALHGGCKTFIVHARKAWLNGLNPKDNRKIPPLNYERVYQLKLDFPELKFIINGQIKTLNNALKHLQNLDGVMMGREVYRNPSILMEVDSKIFGDVKLSFNRIDIIDAMLPYIEHELSKGTMLHHITRHMFGLFRGMYGSKQWRRYLSEHAFCQNAGINIVLKALSYVQY